MEFIEFPKVARLSREVIITEKIDGTNGQIAINDNGDMFVGSRTRWITPANDNHGFAAWAAANKSELLKLGPGRHFGEWWGAGIQRRYGMTEKVFSLFNVSRWEDDAVRPGCCRTVPVLYRGVFNDDCVSWALGVLRELGSSAAPGFMQPEGIVLYHIAAGVGFKKTLEKDEQPKSLSREAA